jgi:hypothetical protein
MIESIWFIDVVNQFVHGEQLVQQHQDQYIELNKH